MSRHFLQTILLDIEGTCSPVSYVYDVLFAYARQHVADFLARNMQAPSIVSAINLMAIDAGYENEHQWFKDHSSHPPIDIVLTEFTRLMDGDVKATGLKQLQGLIWSEGYQSGKLQSDVYDDVPEAMAQWKGEGLDIRIYSSGSAGAQKVFFANTKFGDLTPLLNGFYDTTFGGKRESTSYKRIASDIGVAASAIIFLSDVPAELDAALAVGVQTCLVVRPDSTSVTPPCDHRTISSFHQLEVAVC